MTISKGLNVILERPLVLKIRATNTIPKLPTILLVGSPIPSYSKCLATFSTHEWLDSMLSLVVSLKCSEVLERLCSRVIDVISATRRAAVAREPKHACWLSSS
ncbi:hypothetical protein TorRG33x02_125110 [Trema orientale]|uniref:Uncharacterized protein n=2 Tax=Cannabaceae TaxID=3481 RepID=A0A2P5CAM8_PARAD|nr:hypothetical protein PanWU01x14_168680 [Parasponia andersonii]PON91680.1 hypothetical protein TorRG33x02_125110 [Trema orientale]